MFGRRRTQPAPATSAAPNVHAEAVAVASPDMPVIAREQSLRVATGRQLRGLSGYVVNPDRGDPSVTFERVVSPISDPTASLAHIGLRDQLVLGPQPEMINDTGSTDPQMNAYQAALFRRIER